MNNQLTPCYVSEMPGERARALLIDFAVEAWTHPASPFINGFPAGQESHPRAIVMFETGDVRCVHVMRGEIDTLKRRVNALEDKIYGA